MYHDERKTCPICDSTLIEYDGTIEVQDKKYDWYFCCECDDHFAIFEESVYSGDDVVSMIEKEISLDKQADYEYELFVERQMWGE